MKEYKNPYDLIADSYAQLLDILTEDEQDILRHAADYESMVFQVHDGMVDTVDSINGDIYSSDSFFKFLRESIKYVLKESEKNEHENA